MQLRLEDFRITPATHIVSLGKRCAVAYNLRRFYDFQGAFPFDWWISSANGLVEFLKKPDVDYLYDPSQLELTHKGKTVTHRGLEIQLHHEFPRDEKIQGRPILPDWQSNIANPKSRTTALLDKFLKLNMQGNRIAFVRESASGRTGEIAECLNVLFPLADYTLIELSRVPGSKRDSFGWKGDPALWDETLSSLNLSLDKTNHKPFEGRGIIGSDHSWNAASSAH